MEIIQLRDWTAAQRLEVAQFLLEPGVNGPDPMPCDLTPELLEGCFDAAYEAVWAVWLEETLTLCAFVGVQPIRAFHFACDKRLASSVKNKILSSFLDYAGPILAFTNRKSLARWVAQKLGFSLVREQDLNLGYGMRHYYFSYRIPEINFAGGA